MTEAQLDPGTLLDGRYRLKGLLGSGGMGQVYEAEDIRLGRHVAVKVLHAEHAADDALAERLYREAKAAARADHPAVITTYAHGTDEELAISYVVMERLSGETLAQRLEREGPLPVRFVLRVALALADALASVHAAGVVHRDLKPANVFLAVRGMRKDEIKLLDFGVAKQLDLQTLTTTGQVYGTLTYMAPEQLADSKRVDARCDLYSVGAVLFECLAGRPPFASSNVASMIANILAGERPELAAQRSDAPAALIEIVERCLQRQASARYPGAEALHAALSACSDA
ncbi:MAG TPA: serine/threonine-protein kinase [Polyangiales bacterium]|nr:serine/threonine-protein kinase [Polyangiales bacterium]